MFELEGVESAYVLPALTKPTCNPNCLLFPTRLSIIQSPNELSARRNTISTLGIQVSPNALSARMHWKKLMASGVLLPAVIAKLAKIVVNAMILISWLGIYVRTNSLMEDVVSVATNAALPTGVISVGSGDAGNASEPTSPSAIQMKVDGSGKQSK